MFRGSTEAVFKVALPQLAELDGLFAPAKLPFEVPAIPKAMMQNAAWYVTNQATHVQALRACLLRHEQVECWRRKAVHEEAPRDVQARNAWRA